MPYKKSERWTVKTKKADFAAIGRRFGIDPVIARLIRNRDVISEEEVEKYLHGSKDSLHDPALLKGCLQAVGLLNEKIDGGKKIRIIGDYDIDGVCSTYILYKGLLVCGAKVDYEIPDRMKDGFGLNRSLLELAIEENTDTVITCDNGIAAVDEVRFAKEQGLTVIVTDHHEPVYEETEEGRKYILPPADTIVNPKQPDCPYPYKKLCGAAVAWKVICQLHKDRGLGNEWPQKLMLYAGLATVGDVMDLDGENRILVKEALKLMSRTQDFGILALIKACALDPRAISSYHIGFVLGPCINASGRLDTAKRSLRLLLSENPDEADQIAGQLKALNDERKDLTAKAFEQACQIIENSEILNDRVLVVFVPDCHESIAGIVAGRIREKYYRPVFVITRGENSAKGSGRSIEAYSMFDEMLKCADVFLKFGGHAQAAGFSLEEERIGEMRRRLNENCTLTAEELSEKISIDVPMPVDYITENLISQLDLLEPFGKGNEKPLFAESGLRFFSARIIGKNANAIRFRVMNKNGCNMTAFYFGNPELMREYMTEKYGQREVDNLFAGRGSGLSMDIAYYPQVNEYMGNKSLQIIIKNFR